MHAKIKEKEIAIQMRRKGKTYSEILAKVSVSKSTLSLWLRDVGLSKKQKQTITQKRIEAQKKGAEAMRQKRIKSTKEIHIKAEKEIGELTERELWLIGIALYWAEGAKEKSYGKPSARVIFGNTDLQMIRLYLTWLIRSCGVDKSRIRLSLYIHKNSKERIEYVTRYWEDGIKDIVPKKIEYTYLKKHNPKTVRKNAKNKYYGTLHIVVSASTNLGRQIQGWTKGICKY